MQNTLERRNDDFMRACNQAAMDWRGGQIPTVDEVLEKVITEEAPAFYVDLTTALRRVAEVSRKPRVERPTLRDRLWYDLADRVEAKLRANPDMHFAVAVLRVMEREKAPSFYISLPTARRLYYRLRAQRLAERKHRLGRLRRL